MGRWRTVSSILIVALAAACHSSDGPAGPFAGHWIGQDITSQINLDITLTDNSGNVSGSGTLYGAAISGGSIPVTLAGSESGGDCSLTVNAPPYTHTDLSGTESNGMWNGVLNGSGFAGVAVTLVKQAH